MYAKYGKRTLDLLLSAVALVILSPLLLALCVIGVFAMKGSPFFFQTRPGLREKPFRLIKLRTMTNAKGPDGQLLPDAQRLTAYGHFLRAASLDELPELINILKGDMALVGPRPLLMEYLPLYTQQQRRRHEVRPGLTGLAQINGRNATTWEQRFAWDLRYIEKISLREDLRIVLRTVGSVLRREGISGENCATMQKFEGTKAEK